MDLTKFMTELRKQAYCIKVLAKLEKGKQVPDLFSNHRSNTKQRVLLPDDGVQS